MQYRAFFVRRAHADGDADQAQPVLVVAIDAAGNRGADTARPVVAFLQTEQQTCAQAIGDAGSDQSRGDTRTTAGLIA